MKLLPCPICQKRLEVQDPKEAPYFPFCSDRCRLIDLGRWLGEDYQLPARPADEEELDADPVPDP
jgi:endogenous inhibitor of DNA gyrase (YacG/DUF329 family)